jgi:KaiC/GvpD/RAD55 family RecA-like ATPase
MRKRLLKTGISKVRWCNPADGYYKFEPAVMSDIMTDPNATEMSWLDELFHGGIELPETHGQSHALTLLITGPPGTGKSTFALEMCIALTMHEENNVILTGDEQKAAKILYIASEARPEWMIENARKFGWLDRIRSGDPDARPDIEFKKAAERVFNLDLVQGRDPKPKYGQIALCPLAAAVSRSGRFFQTLRDLLGLKESVRPKAGEDIPGLSVVVVDSLNTVGEGKAEAYQRFYSSFVETGPRLMIFVLDSREGAEAWEFGADIVVRLDKDSTSGYMVRTLEIVKARYQSHVWGKNNLKIREHAPREDEPKDKVTGVELETRLRAHPWMEGGLFVFPSIHYILSRFKRGAPHRLREKDDDGEKDTIATPLPSLTRLLGGGIPSGYTTALLGSRGGHKSHLGHLQALYNVKVLHGRSIIVSLRDGEPIVRKQLIKYINDVGWARTEGAEGVLTRFLESGRLEIVTYMPGYVTPEEFFHRMLLSIYRMRKSDVEKHDIVLIFNSLDQIASRFPLCAREKVFIPGIIQTLSHLGVTSIFIGADEEDTADESIQNLLSMAELIIRMKRVEKFPLQRIQQVLANADDDSLRSAAVRLGGKLGKELDLPMTELTVERYAGGKPAGLQGMLELVTPQSLFTGMLDPGLQFIPYRRIPDPPRRPVAQTSKGGRNSERTRAASSRK